MQKPIAVVFTGSLFTSPSMAHGGELLHNWMHLVTNDSNASFLVILVIAALVFSLGRKVCSKRA